MLIPTRKSIKLKRGHTCEEFIIRNNATRASYAELCSALKISFDEAREIYDKVYNLPLSQIGEWRDKAHTSQQSLFVGGQEHDQR